MIDIYADNAKTLVAQHVGMPNNQRLPTKWRATTAAGVVVDMANLDGRFFCKLLRRGRSNANGVLGLCAADVPQQLFELDCRPVGNSARRCRRQIGRHFTYWRYVFETILQQCALLQKECY